MIHLYASSDSGKNDHDITMVALDIVKDIMSCLRGELREFINYNV